jgi:hypothetical protein
VVVRSYWATEYRLNWVLDLGFREDDSHVCGGLAAVNLTGLRHMAANLPRQEPTSTVGIPTKRRIADWDDVYPLTVLADQDAIAPITRPRGWHAPECSGKIRGKTVARVGM